MKQAEKKEACIGLLRCRDANYSELDSRLEDHAIRFLGILT